MSQFIQTILHEAVTTCGCCAKVRQTFDMVNGEPVGDPQNEILQWLNRCNFHKNMDDVTAYNCIISEMRAINYIEDELISSASPEQLEDLTHDDGSVTKKLKHEILITFQDNIAVVTIPKELENLEGCLTARENFEYIWQK